MRMTPALVAHDGRVGDSDQNSTLGVGALCIAPEVFHTGKRLGSPRLTFEETSFPDAAQDGVCAQRKDDRNWASLLDGQEAEGE